MSDEQRGAGAPTDEERARAIREQLKSLHAFDLAYEMMISLVSFGYQKMGLTDETSELRDLGDARLAIELLRANLEVVEREQGEGRTRDVRSTLAQMQLGYAQAVQLAGGAPAARPQAAEAAGDGRSRADETRPARRARAQRRRRHRRSRPRSRAEEAGREEAGGGQEDRAEEAGGKEAARRRYSAGRLIAPYVAAGRRERVTPRSPAASRTWTTASRTGSGLGQRPEAGFFEHVAGLDDEELLVVRPAHELLEEAQRAGEVLERQVVEGAHGLEIVALVVDAGDARGSRSPRDACSAP